MDDLSYCDTQSKKLMKSLDFSSDNSTDGTLISERNHKNGNLVNTPLVEKDFKSRIMNKKQSTPNVGPVAQPRKLKSKSSKNSDSDDSSSTYSRASSTKSHEKQLVLEEVTVANNTKERNNCTATNHDNKEEEEEEGRRNEEDVDVLRSQVARLNAELRAEKKRNSKTSEKLRLSQTELSAARQQLELEKQGGDGYGSGRVSSIIEEIYEAQKVREEAMLARLRLAVQERDEANLRAKACMKDITNGNKPTPATATLKNRDDLNKSVHKLIGAASSAESARAAHKMSEELLSLVRGASEERSRKEREQTQLLVKERDEMRSKMREMSLELDELKQRLSAGENTNTKQLNKIALLNGQVTEAREERDKALDDLETVRLQYSLEQALTQKLKAIEDGGGGGGGDNGDATRLYEALKQSNVQYRMLSGTCDELRKKKDLLARDNEKLERHVNVLRRKLAKAASFISDDHQQRSTRANKR